QPTRITISFRKRCCPPLSTTLFPYTTLFRSKAVPVVKTKKTKKTKRKAKKQQRVEPTFSTQPPAPTSGRAGAKRGKRSGKAAQLDRKSTRLNSSHVSISYAVFCLKKKRRNRR